MKIMFMMVSVFVAVLISALIDVNAKRLLKSVGKNHSSSTKHVRNQTDDTSAITDVFAVDGMIKKLTFAPLSQTKSAGNKLGETGRFIINPPKRKPPKNTVRV